VSDLEAVELSFFDHAPLVIRRDAHVKAPRDRVFAAVATDPAGWGKWFPGFSDDGRWDTAAPHGVGSVRTVRSLGVRFTETVLAWDVDERWAFRIDKASLPIAKAFAEDYRFADDGEGTMVSWTVATIPGVGLRLAAPLMGFGFGIMLDRAATRLARVV
jgi:Polyketide cyclase / dehydrase and lipid transport